MPVKLRQILIAIATLLLICAAHLIGFSPASPAAVNAHEVETVEPTSARGFIDNSRGRDLARCQYSDLEATTLMLLVPAEAAGSLTVSGQPNFAWYVETQQPVSMSFLLSHPDLADPIYTTSLQANQSGTIAINLPAEVTLEPETWYRWIVFANCVNSADGEIYARSFIKRVGTQMLRESPQDRSLLQQANIYAASGIWHDALGAFLSALRQAPNSAEIKAELRSIVEQVRPDDQTFASLENLLNE